MERLPVPRSAETVPARLATAGLRASDPIRAPGWPRWLHRIE